MTIDETTTAAAIISAADAEMNKADEVYAEDISHRYLPVYYARAQALYAAAAAAGRPTA